MMWTGIMSSCVVCTQQHRYVCMYSWAGNMLWGITGIVHCGDVQEGGEVKGRLDTQTGRQPIESITKQRKGGRNSKLRIDR